MKPTKLARRLRQTGWRESIELLYTALLAVIAELAVRMVPLPRLTAALGIDLQTPSSSRELATDPEIPRRAEIVDKLYRYWPRRNSCLRRGVVLGFRLRRWAPTLMLGVDRSTSELRAHAWVEVSGEVVGDETGDFAPLRFPQQGVRDG